MNYIELKHNAIAMLMGDVKEVERLLKENGNYPFPVCPCHDINENEIILDSFQLACALYDCFRYDDAELEFFKTHHIQEIFDVHTSSCPNTPRIDYSKLSAKFIKWNDWEYFDDEEKELLLKDGAKSIDIRLTNAGISHHEDEVVELLKAGATPYFLNLTDYEGKNFDDDDEEDKMDDEGISDLGGFEVSPMLSILDGTYCDQWDFYGLSAIKEEVSKKKWDDILNIIMTVFNGGASNRILYLVDKYITTEARQKGLELMKEHNFISNILRTKLTK